ncbi:ras-like protein family member 10B [Varroa jacobsoni]|uniref:ras-like protein family member 10B n=1 Tax=Varroa jacobsoni TaxID=62625 RepID=UPI000BF4B05A|nr:ras-like protein family member 10B [Varroa jacobsoni]
MFMRLPVSYRIRHGTIMSLIKVVVLGAPGVGKTSLVQQFVWNEFSEIHRPTTEKHSYLASVLYNDKLFALQVTDLPVIPYFPADSLFEWADYRYYGLRSASAYILVFDVNLPETFQYVKNMREQILQSRSKEVPILIVGNKHDLGEVREHREVAGLVKKHWRCGYVECSAKYNWHVVSLFRELARTIEGHRPESSATKAREHHEASDKKCAIS